jgi:hypothetical protein
LSDAFAVLVAGLVPEHLSSCDGTDLVKDLVVEHQGSEDYVDQGEDIVVEHLRKNSNFYDLIDDVWLWNVEYLESGGYV